MLTDPRARVVSWACASFGIAGGFAMRLFFFILIALVAGAGLGYFGPGLVFAAANHTEVAFAAPDPELKFVKPPRPGQIIRVRSASGRECFR